MKLFKYILLIFLFSQGYLFAEEQVTEQVAEQNEKINAAKKLSAYLENLSSYVANFQQQLISNSRRARETSTGRFVMKRPDRFRWQINSPYEQTIIADGKSIWTIDNDLEQVTVTDIDESIANSPIMILSRKNNQLEKHFTVELMDPETESEVFVLKPQDNSSTFEFILLGFKDGVLNSIELHDSLGQTTTIRMTNIRSNPIISDQQFIYETISEFDLIDSRVKRPEGD